MRLLTDKELVALAGSEVVVDIETYPNYFLICFYFHGIKAGTYISSDNMNRKKLRWILANFTTVTFNGNHYDMVIMKYVLLRKVTCKDLFTLSNEIIVQNKPSWKIYKELGWKSVNNIQTNHIDLKEPSFGQSSLKTYAGRIHAPYMQDLPYPFNTVLTEHEKNEVYKYCWNDCMNTALLRERLRKEIDLRIEMGKAYATDLRSKSDAQVAEVVISRELNWKHGIKAEVPKYDVGYTFKYNVPEYLSYKHPVLQSMLEVIREAEFTISEFGTVPIPKNIQKLDIRIGRSKYKIGNGGLHSTEKCQTVEADDTYMLVDRDVASYYPAIILNQRLFPKHLTRAFLDIYKGIVDKRLAAKADVKRISKSIKLEKNKCEIQKLEEQLRVAKVETDSGKLSINGSFGKFGSPYSILYGPELLIQTTISGQLSLLMLIDMLEDKGFSVVSANTDGVVTLIERTRKDEFNRICEEWERITNFVTEETEYVKLCSRDVNSYIAVKPEGSTKSKGAFTYSIEGDGERESFNLAKNPAGQIISEAVSMYLSRGCNIDDYISSCTDIRKFVFVRKVDGGCTDSTGSSIGKVVRWYQRKGEFGNLKYTKNGNKVPNTDGAYPIMDLSIDFPTDIDYNFYSREAKRILNIDFKRIEQIEMDLF